MFIEDLIVVDINYFSYQDCQRKGTSRLCLYCSRGSHRILYCRIPAENALILLTMMVIPS